MICYKIENELQQMNLAAERLTKKAAPLLFLMGKSLERSEIFCPRGQGDSPCKRLCGSTDIACVYTCLRVYVFTGLIMLLC